MIGRFAPGPKPRTAMPGSCCSAVARSPVVSRATSNTSSVDTALNASQRRLGSTRRGRHGDLLLDGREAQHEVGSGCSPRFDQHRLPARGQIVPLRDDLVLAGRQAADLEPSLCVGEREGAGAHYEDQRAADGVPRSPPASPSHARRRSPGPTAALGWPRRQSQPLQDMLQSSVSSFPSSNSSEFQRSTEPSPSCREPRPAIGAAGSAGGIRTVPLRVGVHAG